MQFVEDHEGEMLVTSKNLSEYLGATTRSDQLLSSVADAIEDLEEFSRVFTVVFPSAQSQQQLYTLLRKYPIRGKRIHDLEMAAIGLASDITQIVTFNAKDFAGISEIEVVEPHSKADS